MTLTKYPDSEDEMSTTSDDTTLKITHPENKTVGDISSDFPTPASNATERAERRN